VEDKPRRKIEDRTSKQELSAQPDHTTTNTEDKLRQEVEDRISKQEALFSENDVRPGNGSSTQAPKRGSSSITKDEPEELPNKDTEVNAHISPELDVVHTVPPRHYRTPILKGDLPSYVADRRAELSKRFNIFMERAVASAEIYSQQLNTYTGTDYSGISALRAEIAAQEQNARSLRGNVDAAKRALDTAFAAQASSQKEVVQLLERKHSWLSPDLERYMSLIRSEHVNEQAVQVARDQLTSAERKLEDARIRLERSERKQYHEEQIWSDTIRRNSTWVTFGLMGFNIVLLLASLILIEPWRRRRLMREVRSALNEKTVAASALPAQQPQPTIYENAIVVDETPISEVLEMVQQDTPGNAEVPPEPRKVDLDVHTALADVTGTATTLNDSAPAVQFTSSASDSSEPLTNQGTPAEAATPPSLTDAQLLDDNATATSSPGAPHALWPDTWTAMWDLYRAYWIDLFSERSVALRKIDITTTALEGAAAGAAFMGILLVLLRPR